MKSRLLFFIFVLISPMLLSLVSQFNLISPYPMTFDIATMLTPVGIIKNTVLDSTILTPFYMQEITQSGRDKNIWIFVIIGLQITGALYLLLRLKAPR